ncbi:hypothetical protein [Synechococcus sp. PCC 7336]|uniref:hypothetical protein n=1 Tax=Synechococcus sp. PCC 7336 TaxID=195250 RepID=UPI00034B8777|nr:hypothetical protein [Synechococcus sp. PCC 7336]
MHRISLAAAVVAPQLDRRPSERGKRLHHKTVYPPCRSEFTDVERSSRYDNFAD